MNEQRIHELLVLRLYGELDPSEAAALEHALAESAESRRFAEELERGLGRVLQERTPLDESWEREWSQRLQSTVEEGERVRHPARRHATHWLLWAAAAGFVAGLLLGPSQEGEPAVDGGPATGAVEHPARVLADATGFERDAPPPRATGSGPLAHIGTLLQR